MVLILNYIYGIMNVGGFMKRLTQMKIKKVLSEPVLTTNCLELINQLFMVYAGEEIRSIEDLYNAPDDFCCYLIDAIHLFSQFESVNKYVDMYESICQYHDMLCGILSDRNIDVQVLFADMVSELQPSQDARLLDVAAGKVPVSSIELAYDRDNVSAMDKFILPAEALKSLGVDAIDGYMTPETDLHDYDFVVAHHPCEATNTLISNCAKHNLPYFIHFCACGLPYDERKGVPSKLWEDKLRQLDPRIKFSTFEAMESDRGAVRMRFGYVLDIPQKEVDEFLKSNYTLHIPDQNARNSVKEVFIKSLGSKQFGE